MSIPIVFGWGKGAKQLGEGFVHACGNCHNVRRFVVVETSRKASLYFVPVAKWSREYLYVCPVCSSGFKIPNRELAQRILAGALADPRSMPDGLAREIARANGIPLGPPERSSDQIEADRAAAEFSALRDEEVKAERTRFCRLSEVLTEFARYKSEIHKDLAHLAVDWVLASLAGSPGCKEVERSFWLTVDAMYSLTKHAATHYGQEGCKPLFSESVKKRDDLLPRFREIMLAAGRSLADLPDGDSRREAVDRLCALRLRLIEHAREGELHDLVAACAGCCRAMEFTSLGCAPISDVTDWLGRLMLVATRIMVSVDEQIAAGTLVRKDGKIVSPGG